MTSASLLSSFIEHMQENTGCQAAKANLGTMCAAEIQGLEQQFRKLSKGESYALDVDGEILDALVRAQPFLEPALDGFFLKNPERVQHRCLPALCETHIRASWMDVRTQRVGLPLQPQVSVVLMWTDWLHHLITSSRERSRRMFSIFCAAPT